MLKTVSNWLGVVDAEKDAENEAGKCNEASKAEKTVSAKSTPAADVTAKADESSIDLEGETQTKAADDNKEEQTNETTRKDKEKSSPQDSSDESDHSKLENVSLVALDTAKQVGSVLYSFGRAAGATVADQACKLKSAVQEKGLLGHFSHEQEKLTLEKRALRKLHEDAVAPWVGYHEEDVMRQQIMALAFDKRYFLTDPPAEVRYEFDFSSNYPIALATLREDANLRHMRFQLVPQKVSEERFWRNYFYRVSLIKQSVQLKSLEQGSTTGFSNKAESDTKPANKTVTLTSSQDNVEEDVGADWETVQKQDVEGYDDATLEQGGGGGGGSTSAKEVLEAEEEEDLFQQIEQETCLKAAAP